MLNIVNGCKNSKISVVNAVGKLVSLYHETDHDVFIVDFKKIIRSVVLNAHKSKDLSRIMDMIVHFCTTSEIIIIRSVIDNGDESNLEIDPVFYHIIRILFEYSDSSCKHVRFFSCAMINKIMDNLPVDIRMDVELLDEITDKLIARLHDYSPNVRSKAICALSRIQDIEDPKCQIIQEYLKILDSDPNSNIRKIVLTSVCITNSSLKIILNRLNDSNSLIRKTLYDRLAKTVSIKVLKIDQRIKIINAGISENNKDSCAAFRNLLIEVWFREQIKSDLVSFVCFFDVVDDHDFIVDALLYIFKQLNQDQLNSLANQILQWIDQSKLIVDSYYQIENVFVWCNLIKFLKSQCQFDHLIPEIGEICKFIDKILSGSLNEIDTFAINELVILLRSYDLNDEAGRTFATDILLSALTKMYSVSSSIDKIISCYLYYSVHPTKAFESIVEIVSEIRQPINQLQSQGKNDEDCALSLESSDTLIYCLNIISESLKCRQIDLTIPSALSLLQSFVLPLVQDHRAEIRILAVQCLSLFCISNKLYACKYFVLLKHIISLDSIEIKNIALSALFDILLVYGYNVFDTCNDEMPDPTDYILELSKNEDDSSAKYIITCGIAKLFIYKRLRSCNLLSSLLLVYIHSSVDNDNKLRSVLDHFFFQFHKSHYIEFIPIIATACVQFINTYITEELFDTVSVLQTSNFISNITSPYPESEKYITKSNEPCCREIFTIKILEFLNESNDETIFLITLQILNSLNFFVNTSDGLQSSQTLLNTLSEKVNDMESVKCIKMINKLRRKLGTNNESIVQNKTEMDIIEV